MDDKQLEQAFPWPADRPLPKPRFGKGPVRGSLPSGPEFQTQLADAEVLKWKDDKLALSVQVYVREGREVWVTARSERADYAGKAVSVGLVSARSDELRRVTVRLGQGQQPGCSGSARVAPLDELLHQLGGADVELAVFLLE